MRTLSFRQFLIEVEKDDEPDDLYSAADDELNTDGETGTQVFDWIPFDDPFPHLRFGQAFIKTSSKDDDEDSDVVWVKPITSKTRGDEKEDDDPGNLKLNVLKCAKKDRTTGKMVQIKCPALDDTTEFPIKKKQWRGEVNAAFKQPAGGMGGGMGMGGLPGGGM